MWVDVRASGLSLDPTGKSEMALRLETEEKRYRVFPTENLLHGIAWGPFNRVFSRLNASLRVSASGVSRVSKASAAAAVAINMAV